MLGVASASFALILLLITALMKNKKVKKTVKRIF